MIQSFTSKRIPTKFPCWSSFVKSFLRPNRAGRPSFITYVNEFILATKYKCQYCDEEFETDRERRYHNRVCKPSLKTPLNVPPVVLVTSRKDEVDSKSKSTDNKTNFDAFESSVHNPRIDKSQEAPVPAQPHSTDITGESKVKGNVFFPKADDCHASTPKKHLNRNTNASPSIQRNKKSKLLLPKPNDSSWVEIDKELTVALPLIFNKSTFNSKTPEQLIQKFDNWLYLFFEEKFGVKIPSPVKQTFVKRPNKLLTRFRGYKNNIRKALRVLKKAGLDNTPEWNKLKKDSKVIMRKHNRLRRAIANLESKRATEKASKAFKEDPFRYTKNVFNPPSATGNPQFSKTEAEKYFVPLYRDEEREYTYQNLKDQPRPEPPSIPFNIKTPSLRDIHRSIRSKRNAAAPGLNGLPYIIYKKCPSIVYYLYLIIKKIWNGKNIPRDWAMAYVSLIAKSSQLHLPSEFRPIAVGDSAGKIFFSIIADRLQYFMINNSYIKKSLQKGFLSGVAGCIEHPFSLYEGLRDAFANHRSICTVWIDLANAFGSVRHNLIQFALEWYHVPEFIRDIILNYYELLCASIVTPDWSTMFFMYDIGCFQGCILSPILFNCVFNLLLDYLRPLANLGYKFKATSTKIADKAYADDLNLTTSTSNDNQKLIDRTDIWLLWTRTMKAKPRKCISLAYRQFKPDGNQMGFVPLTNNIYAPYDPLLTISDKPVRFIWDQKEDTFEGKHFKFLGRWISYKINEIEVQDRIKCNCFNLMKRINQDPAPGPMKLWMYQFGLLSKLSWPFLSQDSLPLNLAYTLHTHINRYLKSWAGLFKSADLGVLYRSRSRFGLGLTSIICHFKRMNVVKCLLLKNSEDEDIRNIYHRRVERESKISTWKATKETTKVEQVINHRFRFAGQTHRQGLGNDYYKSDISTSEYRKLCTQSISELETEKYWAHAVSLNLQGIWTEWFEHTNPLDFSWNTLIYGPGKAIIAFLLNASINSLPSPYLRRLMGYKQTSRCKLCKHFNCNLSHILAGCHTALTSKKYTWRHDSVLLTLSNAIGPHLISHNSKTPSCSAPIPHISQSFYSSKLSSIPPKKSSDPPHFLSGSSDWQYIVDFYFNQLTFPPEIYATNQRPDIIIFSHSLKKVLIVELTVPADENIVAAHTRKKARYTELAHDINLSTEWTATIHPIEVGARGFVSRSMNCFLRKIGFSHRLAATTCKNVSLVTARCSHHIWLSRENRTWKPGPLLLPNDFDTVPSDSTPSLS